MSRPRANLGRVKGLSHFRCHRPPKGSSNSQAERGRRAVFALLPQSVAPRQSCWCCTAMGSFPGELLPFNHNCGFESSGPGSPSVCHGKDLRDLQVQLLHFSEEGGPEREAHSRPHPAGWGQSRDLNLRPRDPCRPPRPHLHTP